MTASAKDTDDIMKKLRLVSIISAAVILFCFYFWSHVSAIVKGIDSVPHIPKIETDIDKLKASMSKIEDKVKSHQDDIKELQNATIPRTPVWFHPNHSAPEKSVAPQIAVSDRNEWTTHTTKRGKQ